MLFSHSLISPIEGEPTHALAVCQNADWPTQLLDPTQITGYNA